MLRLELEQVKGSARYAGAGGNGPRSVDQPLGRIRPRWERFREPASATGRCARRRSREPAALHAQLEQINAAVHNLPELLSLRSLEEKVRILAGAIEHFARQQDRRGHDAFAQIEERLDEISRAIVASAVSAQPPLSIRSLSSVSRHGSLRWRGNSKNSSTRGRVPKSRPPQRTCRCALTMSRRAPTCPTLLSNGWRSRSRSISEKLDRAPSARFADQLLARHRAALRP